MFPTYQERSKNQKILNVRHYKGTNKFIIQTKKGIHLMEISNSEGVRVVWSVLKEVGVFQYDIEGDVLYYVDFDQKLIGQKVKTREYELRVQIYRDVVRLELNSTSLFFVYLDSIEQRDRNTMSVIRTFSTRLNLKGVCSVSEDLLVYPSRNTSEGTYVICNLQSGDEQEYSLHNSAIDIIQLNNDATLCATASESGKVIKVLSIANEKVKEVRRGTTSSSILCIDFSQCGNYISIFSAHGTLHIFSLNEDVNPKSRLSSFSDYGIPLIKNFAGHEWSVRKFTIDQPIHIPTLSFFGKNSKILYCVQAKGILTKMVFDYINPEIVNPDLKGYELMPKVWIEESKEQSNSEHLKEDDILNSFQNKMMQAIEEGNYGNLKNLVSKAIQTFSGQIEYYNLLKALEDGIGLIARKQISFNVPTVQSTEDQILMRQIEDLKKDLKVSNKEYFKLELENEELKKRVEKCFKLESENEELKKRVEKYNANNMI